MKPSDEKPNEESRFVDPEHDMKVDANVVREADGTKSVDILHDETDDYVGSVTRVTTISDGPNGEPNSEHHHDYIVETTDETGKTHVFDKDHEDYEAAVERYVKDSRADEALNNDEEEDYEEEDL